MAPLHPQPRFILNPAHAAPEQRHEPTPEQLAAHHAEAAPPQPPDQPAGGGAMTTPCAHGMPTPASCVDCMYEGNVPPAPPPEVERINQGSFIAKWDGQCPDCNLPIVHGQWLVRSTHGRYFHEHCS